MYVLIDPFTFDQLLLLTSISTKYLSLYTLLIDMYITTNVLAFSTAAFKL